MAFSRRCPLSTSAMSTPVNDTPTTHNLTLHELHGCNCCGSVDSILYLPKALGPCFRGQCKQELQLCLNSRQPNGPTIARARSVCNHPKSGKTALQILQQDAGFCRRQMEAQTCLTYSAVVTVIPRSLAPCSLIRYQLHERPGV
jgi:hypothetical protein